MKDSGLDIQGHWSYFIQVYKEKQQLNNKIVI